MVLQQKKCARCDQTFGCGADSQEEGCWCASMPEVLANPNTSLDCFCPECLVRVIDDKSSRSTVNIRSPKSEQAANALVEGEDYYVEGERIVFTADYHRRRGYCCESGCRHCPYEYQPARQAG